MYSLRLAIAQLKSKPFSSWLSITMFAFGVAIISLLLHFETFSKKQIEGNLAGINLVAGAKGSPLQLIMSSVLHADYPTGNISLEEANKIDSNPLVKKTIPIALGDNYEGYRIVGTSHKFYEQYNAELRSGEWNERAMEVVIGSSAAEKTKLDVGNTFSGVHGFLKEGHHHEDQIYKVTGILKPTGTVIDRLILTKIESIWSVHGSHSECDEHDHEEEGHDHTACEHNHEEEGHDHETCEHNHEEEGHNHETCEHNHEEEGHEHETCEHNHKEEGHNHASCEHNHEEVGHDHETCEHNHEEEKHDDEQLDMEPALKALLHKVENQEDLTSEEIKQYTAYKQASQMIVPQESDKEITALLIFYRSPLAATTLPRMINQNTSMQAASPTLELNRLMSLLGTGFQGLRILAWVIILFSGINIMVHLLNKLNQEIYEIALLRSMGVGKTNVLLLLFLQGIILSVLGWVVGLGLVRIVMFAIQTIANNTAISLSYGLILDEFWILGYAILVGFLGALVPAMRAYRTDIHYLLNRES